MRCRKHKRACTLGARSKRDLMCVYIKENKKKKNKPAEDKQGERKRERLVNNAEDCQKKINK